MSRRKGANDDLWLLEREVPRQRRRRPLLAKFNRMDAARSVIESPGDVEASSLAMRRLAEELLGTRVDVESFAVKVAGVWASEALGSVYTRDRQGRRQRQAWQIVCGREGGRIVHDAAYFALRKLLVGEAAVCGVLLDQPGGVMVTLEPSDEPWSNRYLLRLRLPGTAGAVAGCWELPVGWERRGAEARTSYLIVGALPAALKAFLAPNMAYKTPVRLHRLIAALRGTCLREGRQGQSLHVHHENGIGGDSRACNLTPMPAHEHAEGHIIFGRDGELLDRGDRLIEEARLVTWEGGGGGCPEILEHIRHSRQDALLEHLRWRDGDARPRFPVDAALAADLALVAPLSRRKDFRRGAVAILDVLTSHRRAMRLGEIACASSLPLSTVRGHLARLSEAGALASWTEARETWAIARSLALETGIPCGVDPSTIPPGGTP